MADQSQLASILAALSQAQAKQAALGGGNPGLPPAPPTSSLAPNPAFAGYPPPSASGAIDLSSIKPSNSGSMDFSGTGSSILGSLSTTTGMYDLGGVGSSSSYDRRDRDRDHHSSYYDDYRGRERSPSYGGSSSRRRDRSYSPPHRGGGRGSDSPDHDQMNIDVAYVGLIIGRGGDSLRRVENDTGARVQFVPDDTKTAKYRLCNITGTSSQVRAARRALQRLIDEHKSLRTSQGKVPSTGSTKVTPGPGESSQQMLVPDMTVGLVIGRGGDTIRELQDKSRCHINIVSERESRNGLRPVNLIGSIESIEKARELIDEIVNNDTNAKVKAAGNDQMTTTITVPMDAVGMIIGKGGETVKEMQQLTSCKINVSSRYNPSDPTREITLAGTNDTIAHAKQAIDEKVHMALAKKQSNPTPTQSAAPGASYGAGVAYNTSSYGGAGAAAAPASSTPAAAGAQQADPYAAYGGYQNYVAMWQQWQTAQAQAQAQQGSSNGAAPSS